MAAGRCRRGADVRRRGRGRAGGPAAGAPAALPAPLPLAVLAVEIDALGAAAIGALAEIRPVGGAVTAPPRRLDAALAAAAALVALLTLLPQGGATAWGAPVDELRWYAGALTSEATLLQLAGNLVLLAPLAVLAVLRWPALGTPRRLAAAAVGVAVGIELLQGLLPLGRVVSPVDAALNTVGALLAGGAASLASAPSRVPTA